MNDSTREKKTPLTEEQTNVIDIFKREAIDAAGSLHIPEDKITGVNDYVAYQKVTRNNDKADYLNVYRMDGTHFTVPYYMIDGMDYPSDQQVVWSCTNSVLTLTGQHLEELSPLINGKKLLSIFCFNPAHHTRPPETEILITHIARLTIKEFEAG